MRSCPRCGGALIGDGYSSVIHCEFADDDQLNSVEPDANPIYCNYEDECAE